MAQTQTCSKMPVIFLSHGGGPCYFLDGRELPMFAGMDKNSKSAGFLRNLQSHLPEKPRAIVVISAHWEESQITVGVQRRGTSLIYDYYGFPEETYSVPYPAPTDVALAERIQQLLQSKGIETRTADRGFDHGVFVPLKLAFPDADVPIVQVSLHSSLDPPYHIAVGEALAPLTSEGVLVIGSGAATHSLREIKPAGAAVSSSVEGFRGWLLDTLGGGVDLRTPSVRERLANIMRDAPDARRWHPRTEHLIPLHVAYGAAIGAEEGTEATPVRGERIFEQVVNGNLALDSFLFSS